MKMKKVKGIFLADIHIGDMPREQLKHEFEHVIYPYLEKNKIDFVIFAGDYFGHKLYLNDENTKLATEILQEIDSRLKPETKVRMVYGTESHEENQYGPIQGIMGHRDFKVIYHVCEEELFPEMNVLYLPEELLTDPDEYYKEYFENPEKEKYYQLIIGHGTIREAMVKAASAIEDRKNVKRRVPVFRTGELRKICDGLVVFGHYHVHTMMDPYMMYVGSFSRWKFGEEDAKGFLEATFHTKEKSWTYEFFENTYAPMYKTIGFGYKNTVFSSLDELKRKMDHFENLTKEPGWEHLKMEFNVPETCENPEYVMNFLRERFKQTPNIKINIENGYIEQKREDGKKKLDEDYDKYAPIFDPNTEMEDRISYYVDVEYNKKIPVDLAALYLYHDLNDILKYQALTEEEKIIE